ncbi:MAG: energy-coupling factor transporter transmembrane component T [bacterium]|nr:energy-coupling factor transporter transmembrane component T [bacterium]
MIKDITIGQYIYGTSPLHKLEPWVKIVLTLVYAAVVLMLKAPAAYAVYFAFTAAAVLISTVPVKMLLKGLKPLIWLFAFTSVFNLFLTPGEPLCSFRLGALAVSISRAGIKASVLLALRLTLLVMGTSLLTLTTSPLQLTDGIEKLLKPLAGIKVPAHEIAMMTSIAIRFIPTIGEEADRLMKAQKARGADMESGGIFKRARAMTPILIPLLTSAFRRADELAVAMDARCYGGGKRTRMKVTHAGRRDAAAAAVLAAVSAAALIAGII